MIQGADPDQVDVSGINIEVADNMKQTTQQKLLEITDSEMSFDEVPDDELQLIEEEGAASGEPKPGKKKTKMGAKKDSKAIEREKAKEIADEKKRLKEERQ